VVAAVLLVLWPRGGNLLLGDAVAILEEVQGDVTIVAPDGQVELAENGQSLFAGQEIQTGADDSSTVVRIHDSRLNLASETRLKIGSGHGAEPMFFLSEGIINAEVLRRPLVLRSALAELSGKEGKFSFVSL